jgi:hypothetical protein
MKIEIVADIRMHEHGGDEHDLRHRVHQLEHQVANLSARVLALESPTGSGITVEFAIGPIREQSVK